MYRGAGYRERNENLSGVIVMVMMMIIVMIILIS
jgi:hypothetical protein